MYSLVSAPVLGFDLVRLPGGPRAAEVVLRALAMDAAELTEAGRHLVDDPARDAAWLELAAVEPERGDLAQVAATMALDAAAAGDQAVVRGGLDLLSTARIGTLGALLRCVRHDVLDWSWRRADDLAGPPGGGVAVQDDPLARGAAVVCDAVASCYTGHLLAPAAQRRLAAPWLAATRRLPDRRVDLGPTAGELERLLGRLARLDAVDRRRLAAASDRSRAAGPGWAGAVHDASWAVHLADRVRPTAAAQLRAVVAVAAAGVPVCELAAGTWNLVSGVVQATAVRDLLDGGAAHALLQPWVEAVGPAGG